MNVRIPTPLRAYTGGEANVEVDVAGKVDVAPDGARAGRTTVADVLDALDARFPGIRFRVVDEQGRLRQHMMVWLDGERCRDLSAPVDHLDEVVLMQALSGG